LLLRFLFFALLAYIIISMIKAHIARRKSNSFRRGASSTEGEEMVLDPQCQSYIPKREAIHQEGNYFCSRECAQLFLSR